MARGILGQALVTNSSVAIYTAGTGVETTNMNLMLCCTATGTTINVHVSQSGAAANDALNIVYQEQAIADNETLTLSLPPMTGGGGKVYVEAAVTDLVVATLYGNERLP